MRLFFVILLLTTIASSVWVLNVRYSQSMVISLCDQLLEELVEEESKPDKDKDLILDPSIAPLPTALFLVNKCTFSPWLKGYHCLPPYLEINNPPPEL